MWIIFFDSPAQNISSMQVQFTQLKNKKIQQCFMKALEGFESLQDQEFIVTQKRISGSTMQAQPFIKLSNLFTEEKKYWVKVAVYVRDSEKIKVADLPEEVLIGWFAHELGHVEDYKHNSNFKMIGFGLRYVLFPKFKRKVEHSADYIAIEKGFKSEILASKRFIFESDLVSQKYLDKLSKFYLPIEKVELCMDGEKILPVTEL